jgi:Holliday junction DNA helicase RuvA
MIASVNGRVTVRRADHVVVECAGVGYRLAVSAETLRAVPAAGKDCLLHTHLVLRDDGMHLFGFASEEERELFLMLNGVQGVGPKVSLGGTSRRCSTPTASTRTPRPRLPTWSCSTRSRTRLLSDTRHGTSSTTTTTSSADRCTSSIR